MKTSVVLGAGLSLLFSAMAIAAIASDPDAKYETEGRGVKCYQTMGYCQGVLTYKCTPDATAENCRLFVCNPGCSNDPITPPGK